MRTSQPLRLATPAEPEPIPDAPEPKQSRFAVHAAEAAERSTLATASDLCRLAGLDVGRAASLFAAASGSPGARVQPTAAAIEALRKARDVIVEVLGEIEQ